MTALDTGCLVLDTETTAPDPNEARLVQVSIGRAAVVNGIGQWDAWTELVNPGVPIPEGAASVHGITDDMVADARPEADVVEEVADRLHEARETGLPTVIFNAPYDLTVLDRAMRRAGHRGLVEFGSIVDPYIIDKTCDKYRPGSRKLIAMAKHYGVPLDIADAHGAEADAFATVRVARAMLDRLVQPRIDMPPGEDGGGDHFPRLLRECTADQLHQLQVAWYEIWMTDFAAYRRKRGEPLDDESTDWPIRPWRGEVGA